MFLFDVNESLISHTYVQFVYRCWISIHILDTCKQKKKLKQIVKTFMPFTQKVVLSANYPFSSQVVTTGIYMFIFTISSRENKNENKNPWKRKYKKKYFRNCLHFVCSINFYCLPCSVCFILQINIFCEAKFDPYISISVLHIALFFFLW